jgi:hypothetical protein
MSTMIVFGLLALFLLCLAVVVGRRIATPDPWDRPQEADHEAETMAAEVLGQLERAEITLPRRSPWHP